MKPDQVMNVVAKYTALLQLQGCRPIRTDISSDLLDRYQKQCHTLWMCEQIQAFVGMGEMYKANRWLGFVQGVLWALDHLTIDQMREDNRS